MAKLAKEGSHQNNNLSFSSRIGKLQLFVQKIIQKQGGFFP
jgi:hypothetical protein